MVLDLAGYTKAFQRKTDEEIGDFIDDYYVLVERAVTTRGGTVIKFMGDGCLITFPGDGAVNAVRTATDLERALDDLCRA